MFVDYNGGMLICSGLFFTGFTYYFFIRLFHNLIHQGLITVNYIIDNIVSGNCFEMLFCAMDLRFFNQAELHGIHRAFCFCDKIYMLDISFIKCNSPVRIIFPHRCRNIKTIRQLYINSYFRVNIQFFSKFLALPYKVWVKTMKLQMISVKMVICIYSTIYWQRASRIWYSCSTGKPPKGCCPASSLPYTAHCQ